MSSVPESQRHPVSELLARYAAVLSAAWAQRDELVSPKHLALEHVLLAALSGQAFKTAGLSQSDRAQLQSKGPRSWPSRPSWPPKPCASKPS
ncbi:hypothetical protein [Inhella proteolytica]|uniref:Uncharacterized protein n=1 Tax=Inhella proteolytica TaxID=2795029 RepID=A0A931NF94_9BURK|nr:hypothetical protein [Inhella proteolytica]MBH9578537.1 hypothetical protein [Inhella proteolytica]